MPRILVAVDETEASARVASFVNEFFGGLDVEIVALHVGDAVPAWYPDGVVRGALFAWPYPVVPGPGGRTANSTVADEEIAEGYDTIRRSGIDSDEDVVELGDPVDRIREAAVQQDVQLIVVGSSDKNVLERMWSGSVSRELGRDAPRPVLVVP